MGNEETWSGQWVADRLGLCLVPEGPPLRELLGLALRRNAKRAHLLVSTVLGKHVPQLPHVVHGTGVSLGERVRALLGDAEAARAVVLGYAETATALGHSVADGLSLAPYLHSTRRPVRGVVPVGGFEEEHSHATSHLLLPEDPHLLAGDGPLVLVDDEFSTGNTVLNTIEALHRRFPRNRYVIVALVDMRTEEHRRRLEGFAQALGARVDVVALAAGTVRLPDDVLRLGRDLVDAHDAHDRGRGGAPDGGAGRGGGAGDRGALSRVELSWPLGLPDGGRHGFGPAHRAELEAALPTLGKQLAEAVGSGRDGNRDGIGRGGRAGRTDRAGGDRDAGSSAPRRVLVLGCEELMYTPLRLAGALQDALGSGAEVRFSTTTRSPVLAVDDPGYAIRTCISFPAHDAPADGPGPRFAYNVSAGDEPGRRFDTVVAVVDGTADTPALHAAGGLLDCLRNTTDRVLLAVIPSYVPVPGAATGAVPEALPGTVPRTADGAAPPLTESATAAVEAPVMSSMPRATGSAGAGGSVAPTGSTASTASPGFAESTAAGRLPEPLRGPAFSSYASDEVAWLLQDLSDVSLEAPTEEREEAIQSGGAHYAESLPVEYQPSEEYQALFRSALEASADRIARAVGVVTETVLAERGEGAVLASLARAGTPIGVLMRRWARYAHGLALPHYAVSIVRGRGIDTVALRYLAEHHRPEDVVFVDGWTGKGAITRELASALGDFPGFDPEIAVLADPGGCVRTYGTREDFLVPSACLNSTVSGLVSRTVLRADLVGPYDFHGAKFYRELTGSDVSGLFLDAVTERFAGVREAVDADRVTMAGAERAPTWEGWAAVERISDEYGIGDVNLVKPGVGETTRVLLRRVPWRILASRGAGSDLDHVRLLAKARGVPVEEVDGLPYSCVGLIHPRFTRGAVGASGTAAGGGR